MEANFRGQPEVSPCHLEAQHRNSISRRHRRAPCEIVFIWRTAGVAGGDRLSCQRRHIRLTRSRPFGALPHLMERTAQIQATI